MAMRAVSAGGRQQRSIDNPVHAAVQRRYRDVIRGTCRRSAIFSQVVDGGGFGDAGSNSMWSEFGSKSICKE
uniref:Uncharacterized protein n=1 Tax=Oryza punctata TaxID=4537 RepID=A0A0E0KMT0_ORYPU